MSSSSCNNQQNNIPVEEEQEKEGNKIELETVGIRQEITASSSSSEKQKEKESIKTVGDDHQNKLEYHLAKASTIGSSSSREFPQKKVSEEDDDDDVDEGFKTPTSSDHKIPVITQCPPAPIKPRPARLSLKRKASPPPAASSGAHRSLQFDDSSTEVESIFRPLLGDKKDNVVGEPQDRDSKRAKNADEDED